MGKNIIGRKPVPVPILDLINDGGKYRDRYNCESACPESRGGGSRRQHQAEEQSSDQPFLFRLTRFCGA